LFLWRLGEQYDKREKDPVAGSRRAGAAANRKTGEIRVMAEVQWWYAQGDDQLGPVSPADLRRLAGSGGLGPADLVWREGMGEWAPAARIKGLFPDYREPEDVPHPAATYPSGPPLPGASPMGEPSGLAVPPPDSLFAPDAAGHAVFAGTSSSATPPPMGAIESGLFRTVAASDVEPPYPAVEREARPLGRLRVPLVLLLAQGVLWGTCGLVVLLGGLLFTVSRLRGKPPAEEAASATVLGMFFIGAYVVAQAGEKISQLVLAVIERRRKR
jgi:GYF domain 2